LLNVLTINGNHNIEIDNLHIAGKGKSEEIIIKDGAWIGAESIILGGSRRKKICHLSRKRSCS